MRVFGRWRVIVFSCAAAGPPRRVADRLRPAELNVHRVLWGERTDIQGSVYSSMS